MNAETLSNMLNGQVSGKGYLARCPAHNDKSPSLSITDGDNGLTLINCFAGCSAESIVSSLGLEIKDLYQESSFTYNQRKKYKKIKELSELWKALNHELHVLLQIVSNRVCDKALSKDRKFKDYRPDFKPLPVEFWERELLAANRVKNLLVKYMSFEANDPKHEEIINRLNLDENSKTTSLSWTEKFTVSQEEAIKYDDPEWIYKNLIIKGHMIVIPAPPNGGKTTIFMHLAREMAAKGFNVNYVNADVGQSDAKLMIKSAEDGGFTLLLPDLKEGLSMDTVVTNLNKMNMEGGNFNNIVFIFDTLKKMTDVINKKSKDLYKTLRGLSAKGMTIILLAHTNKYNDKDGKPIYEGTGDLRADVDELIYLTPKKNDNGSMIVSTVPDKVRGKFEPISFEIDINRNIKQLDIYVNTPSLIKSEITLNKNMPIIKQIIDAINNNKTSQKEITDYCINNGLPKQRVRKILNEYSEGKK